MLRFAIAVLLLSISFAADWTKLNDLIQEAIDERVFPGATIVVANETSIIFKKNYGYFTYNYEFRQMPVTNNTKYDVASITKVMATTFAVMNQVSSRSIALNDTVAKYFRYYDTNKKGNTTIANLMLHNAGLPYDYPGALPKNQSEVLDYITFVKPISDVGTQFHYSNLGFLFLSKIIEQTSRKNFSAYFDQNKIFAGLKNSGFNPPASDFHNIPPTQYDSQTRKDIVRGEAHERLAYFFNGVAGHSGLFTTADDMIRFMRILLCKGKLPSQTTRVISESIVETFTTKVQGLPYANTHSYGFDTYCPGRKMTNCFGHDGSTGAMAWADKSKKIAFVVLSNRGHPDVNNNNFEHYKGPIADAIFEALGY